MVKLYSMKSIKIRLKKTIKQFFKTKIYLILIKPKCKIKNKMINLEILNKL